MSSWNELVGPEKVILFGSYATDRWVNDKYVSGHITYEYVRDFDILVVTSLGEKHEEHHIQEMLGCMMRELCRWPSRRS